VHLDHESSSRERLRAARLYAITPDADAGRLVALAEAWMRGGVDVVQLRVKTMPRGALLDVARRVRDVCGEGVLFIVNDHLDVAMLAGADGVHLGEEDLSVVAARRVAGPSLLIGASASTAETARAAVRAGADHIGAGPAWATPIKAEKPAIGPVGVAAVQAAVDVPVFAIGGVDASRVPALRAAGVERACVIRALSDVPDPERAARELRGLLS
jgi:thiamine-phosphate pyrophosphorylase